LRFTLSNSYPFRQGKYTTSFAYLQRGFKKINDWSRLQMYCCAKIKSK
jgi:hypothetical protein